MKTRYMQNQNKKNIWYLYKVEEPNILIRIATYDKKTNKLTIDIGRVEGRYLVNTFEDFLKIATKGSEE